MYSNWFIGKKRDGAFEIKCDSNFDFILSWEQNVKLQATLKM